MQGMNAREDMCGRPRGSTYVCSRPRGSMYDMAALVARYTAAGAAKHLCVHAPRRHHPPPSISIMTDVLHIAPSFQIRSTPAPPLRPRPTWPPPWLSEPAMMMEMAMVVEKAEEAETETAQATAESADPAGPAPTLWDQFREAMEQHGGAQQYLQNKYPNLEARKQFAARLLDHFPRDEECTYYLFKVCPPDNKPVVVHISDLGFTEAATTKPPPYKMVCLQVGEDIIKNTFQTEGAVGLGGGRTAWGVAALAAVAAVVAARAAVGSVAALVAHAFAVAARVAPGPA